MDENGRHCQVAGGSARITAVIEIDGWEDVVRDEEAGY